MTRTIQISTSGLNNFSSTSLRILPQRTPTAAETESILFQQESPTTPTAPPSSPILIESRPLHQLNMTQDIELLINSNANLQHLLYLAIKKGKRELVEKYLERGINFHLENYLHGFYYSFPLYWAFRCSQFEILKILAKNFTKHHDNFSILKKMFENGHFEILKAIIECQLESKIEPNLLYWAIEQSNNHFIDFIGKCIIDYDGGAMLFAHGLDTENQPLSDLILQFSLQFEEGLGILKWAISNRHQDFTMELVNKHRASTKRQDKYGQSALHYASIIGSPELADFLLSHGANPHLPNKQLQTPYGIALALKHREVLRVIQHHIQSRAWTQN